MNYGVRNEYFSVPQEGNNQVWNFDPAANGVYPQNGSIITDAYGYSCALAYAQTDFIYVIGSGEHIFLPQV